MGRRHVSAYRALVAVGATKLQITAVCDPRPRAAEEAAEIVADLLGTRPAVFSDHEALLESGLVEALDIVTDPSVHHLVAVPVLNAGLHVICEKPLGVTVRACRAILAQPPIRVLSLLLRRTTEGTDRTDSLVRCSSKACSARCT